MGQRYLVNLFTNDKYYSVMAILPLVTYPDPRLKIASEPVAALTDDVRQLVQDMLDTMYAKGGIGLAAVQVGHLKRILVMDVDQDERGVPVKSLVLINPEIIWESDEISVYKEGCLSFPGQYADVERPDRVRVRFMDQQGKMQELEADELLATCLQHEMDHLNGITFTDHLSRMKRDMIHRKLIKEQRVTVPQGS
jgi:peptide deformylase